MPSTSQGSTVLDGLLQKRSTLIELIRTYVRDQLWNWKRIPFLALEADGRTGYNERYQYAYENGFWMIHGDVGHDRVVLYVDCATGELLDRFQTHMHQKPVIASDDLVAGLISRLTSLDATRIVEGLEQAAAKPVASYISNTAEELDIWRGKVRGQLGLKHHYSEEQRGRIVRLSFGD